MKTFKTLTVGVAALSVLATAGLAVAAPAQHGPQRDHRVVQQNTFSAYDHRADHRFKAGRYQAPRGYQNRSFRRGEQLPQAYRGKGYVVDHNRYGLRTPPRGYQYVRVGNDVVLTAVATGLITAIISQMFN